MMRSIITSLIKEKIINDFNAKYPVYENGKFSMKFKAFIDSLGLLQQWPRTPSGALSITEKNIYNFAQSYPEINEFYFVKEFVESQKLKGFVVGPDGRARTSLNMFGIKTGRTNQSTALYPFNAAKPMRNILCPALIMLIFTLTMYLKKLLLQRIFQKMKN